MNSKIRQAAIAIVLAGLLLSPRVAAQEIILQTGDTPVDRLRANCASVQSTLSRLHTSDTLLRVNTGQRYNDISSRLMARFNSRLAINRIDSTKLVEISSRFEKEIGVFTENYSDYESLLSSMMKVSCKNNPTGFYAKLLSTRDARHKLSVSVDSMNDSINEYRMAVEQLRQDMFGKKDTGHDED